MDRIGPKWTEMARIDRMRSKWTEINQKWTKLDQMD